MEIKYSLAKMNELGIELWVDEDKLRFKAPSGVMTESIRQELRSNKEELIAYLKKQTALIRDEENRYQPFDLTDIQASYLLGGTNLYGYGGVGCKVFAQIRAEKLEIQRLQFAWEQVVFRHDMLHAVIHQDGTQQVLQNFIIPKITCIDLSGQNSLSVTEELDKLEKFYLNKQYKPEESPLYDIVLVQEKEKDTICFAIDMLIADFSSIKIIMNDFEIFYYGQQSPKELEITFQDFLSYQKNSISKTKYQEAKEYWCEKLASLVAPELPVLAIESQQESMEFEQYRYSISNNNWEKLLNLSKNHELTPSNILLTVYAQVIGLWSRQLDFTINITMANRPNIHKDILNIVGDFTIVNMLEVHMGGRKSFLDQATEIQEQLWSDLRYNQFSGVEVIRELNRQGYKNRLFPIVFTSTIGASDEKEHNEFKLIRKITQTPQVWIDCQVSTQQDGVLVNWDVRKNIFPEEMLRQAFSLFVDVVEKLTNNILDWNKYTPLKLSGSTVETRKKINATEGKISQGLLYDGIVNQIKNNANSVAIVSDGKIYNYGELGLYALTIQQKISANGIKPGDIVAIDLDKGIWQIAAILGILWAGAVYLPLDKEQPSDRKKIILQHSQAQCLVTQSGNEIKDIQKICIDDLTLTDTFVLAEIRVLNTQPAYIIYTSGSTGTPKGVVIAHQAALNTIEELNNRYNITSNDKIFALSSIAFDLSVYDLFGILAVGGTMVIPNQNQLKNPQYWEEIIFKSQVTIWNSVPAQMQMLLFYIKGLSEEKNYKLRIALLSGDWIPVKLPFAAVEVFHDLKIVSLGGATEAAIWSIYYDIDLNSKYENSIPYGYPLKNQYFKILNKNMNDCPDGVIGDLYIGGIGLADKYLHDDPQTKQSFIIHPDTSERLYRTGDIGKYHYDGLIEFYGREDTQVKINGYRIELNEIEHNIQMMDDIESCVVMTDEEQNNGNTIIAFIQPEYVENTLLKINNDDFEKMLETIAEEITNTIDQNLLTAWINIANQTAIYDIYECLKGLDIFTEERNYSLEQMYKKINIHPKYQDLLQRWLKVLCDEKIITYDETGNVYSLINKSIPKSSNKISWQKWWEIENSLNYSKKLLEYFQLSSLSLPRLLNGEIDPLDLYYPQGNQDIPLAAYHDNIVSQVLNKVMILALTALRNIYKKEFKSKIRILELGAGVGGTSLDIIPSLKDENVEYIFSDISQYFLNVAKVKFEEYDFISYQLIDINESFVNQGIELSSIDVIICNNVLHNATAVEDVLSEFREILVEDGVLIVAETTGENYSLLTSVAFHEGLRKERGHVFFTTEELLDLFNQEDIVLNGMFPKDEHFLSKINQAVFVGQYVADRKKIDTATIMETLKQKIPEYMLPTQIKIVHKIPLTQNGKIDRKRLIGSFKKGHNPFIAVTGEYVIGELEKTIEKIWAKALNREFIFRNENFYQAGGDSLLIAQVVAEMKENIPELSDWEWNTLMMEIIQTPTIQEIAQKIMADTLEEKEENLQNKNIILFSNSHNKKKITILFHDGTGLLTPYQYLIPYLKDNSTDDEMIIGLENIDSNEYLSYTADTLIQNLGTKYGSILLDTDYEEYELIGYCFGSMVAVETAKFLMQEGKHIKPIIAIDTPSCDRRIQSQFLLERVFGLSLGADIVKCGYSFEENLLKRALINILYQQNKDITDEVLCALTGEYSSIGECFQKLARENQDNRLARLYESFLENTDNKLNYSKEKIQSIFHMSSLSFAAAGIYNDMFIGNIVELYCDNEEITFFPMVEKKGGFWHDKVLGNLIIKTIAGNHNTCLREPIVKDIVTIINNY